jgi:hypothetical protein
VVLSIQEALGSISSTPKKPQKILNGDQNENKKASLALFFPRPSGKKGEGAGMIGCRREGWNIFQ